MDLGLEGKVAIVTGGSRGLGKAAAMSLAGEGCRVVICARGEAELEAAATEIEARGGEVLTLAVDITEPGAAQRLVGAAVERFGGVDVLVNNAGTNRRMDFADTTDEDWSELFAINFDAHARISRAAIPQLKRRGGGAILFVASIFGREAGGPGLSLYNTTKSALISLAKIMALELAGDGIRVLSVAPGSIRFPGGSWDKRCKEDPEGMAEFIRDNLPLGRFGTAEEVGDAIAFLASERASLLTGASIQVDGAQSRSLI